MQNAPNQETNFFSQKSFPFGKKKQTQHLCIYQTTCKAQEKNSKATAKQASHLEAASSKCCPHHPWGKMAPKANEGESTRPSASHRPWPNPPQAPGAFWAAPGAVAGAAPPHPAEPQGSHTALGTQNQEGEHDLPSVQDFHPAPACPGLLTACSRQPASRAPLEGRRRRPRAASASRALLCSHEERVNAVAAAAGGPARAWRRVPLPATALERCSTRARAPVSFLHFWFICAAPKRKLHPKRR